jgi:hypothetical protein
MSTKVRWTANGTTQQIFSFKGERLFYVTMVDGWEDQKEPTCKRIPAGYLPRGRFGDPARGNACTALTSS